MSTPEAPEPGPSRTLPIWGCVLLVLLVAAIRLVHLEADTPADFVRTSYGPYVDEGYKTLAARNLVLYGESRWNDRDRGDDWSVISPVTTRAFRLMFEAFRPDLYTARATTVVWFAALLLAVGLALRRRYPAWLLIALLAGLGLEAQMLVFSRIALLVIPLALVSLLPTLAAGAGLATNLGRFALVALPSLVLATLGIKVQAPAYFVGPFVGFGLWWWTRPGRSVSARWGTFAVTAVAAVAALYVLRELIFSRVLGIGPETSAWEILLTFVNPMHFPSALLLAASALAAVHLLLRRPEAFDDPFVCILTAVVAVGPWALGVFSYDPLRYYAPLVPAHLLLVAEWVRCRPWEGRTEPPRGAGMALAILLAAQGLFAVAQAVNLFLLENIPLRLGADPGLSEEAALAVAGPIALLVSAAVLTRKLVWAERWLPRLVVASLVGTLLWSVVFASRILVWPQYQLLELAQEIHEVVPGDATFGGDWAPLFALGSEIPTLHVTSSGNLPFGMKDLGIDYYLHSDTEIVGRDLWHVLETLRGEIILGEPLLTSEYIERRVRLFRVSYADEGAENGSQP